MASTPTGIPSGPQEQRPPAGEMDDGTRWNLILDDGTIVEQEVSGDTWVKVSKEVGSLSTEHIDTADWVIYDDSGTYKTISKTGTGTYSDTDIFALINTVLSNESRTTHIHVTAGTYDFGTPLQLQPGLRLTGAGVDATIFNAVTADINGIEYGPLSNSSDNFPMLENFKIDGNKGGLGSTSGSGLVADPSNKDVFDLHVEDVFITSFADDGMTLKETWGYKFTDCLIEFCGRDGIRIDNSVTGSTLAQLSISGTYIAHQGGYGINCVGGASKRPERMQWFVQCADNDTGNIHVAEGLENSQIIAVCEGSANGDGLAMDDAARFNDIHIIASNNGAYGYNEVSTDTAFNAVDVVGRNNTSGLVNRDTATPSLNVVNGRATNNGDPSAGTGRWSGRNNRFRNLGGHTLEDINSTAPHNLYQTDRASNWIQIG